MEIKFTLNNNNKKKIFKASYFIALRKLIFQINCHFRNPESLLYWQLYQRSLEI